MSLAHTATLHKTQSTTSVKVWKNPQDSWALQGFSCMKPQWEENVSNGKMERSGGLGEARVCNISWSPALHKKETKWNMYCCECSMCSVTVCSIILPAYLKWNVEMFSSETQPLNKQHCVPQYMEIRMSSAEKFMLLKISFHFSNPDTCHFKSPKQRLL